MGICHSHKGTRKVILLLSACSGKWSVLYTLGGIQNSVGITDNVDKCGHHSLHTQDESNTSPAPMMFLDVGTLCISGLLHSPWWVSSSSALSSVLSFRPVRTMRLLSPGIVVFPCSTLQVPFWCQVPFDHICATLPCRFCSASWQAVAFWICRVGFPWVLCSSLAIFYCKLHLWDITQSPPSQCPPLLTHPAPSSPTHLSCYPSAAFS